MMKRNLGAFEHLYWLYNQFYPMDFATVAKLNGRFSVEQLATALRQLQNCHPLLRVRIETDAIGQPQFVETNAEIPIRFVARMDNQHWQRELEIELTHSLDWQVAPLIRIVLLQAGMKSELMIVCHHAIADGLSGIYLMRDIVQALSGKQFEHSDLSTAISLESALPSRTPDVEATVKPPDYLPSPPRCFPPHIRTVVLSPELTQQLIQQSRSEGTTVHGAISAAFLLALTPQEIEPVQCLHPVNVRPYLSLSTPDSIGLYILLTTTSHSLSQGLTFWDIARSVKAQLSQIDVAQQLVEERQLREPTMAHLTDATGFMKDLQSQYPCHLTVTNLGRVEVAQQYGDIQIEMLYAPIVMSGVDEGRIVGAVTLGDRLALTLVCSPQLDVGRAERDRATTAFLSAGIKHLENAVFNKVD